MAIKLVEVDKKLLHRVVDKQFELAGIPLTLARLWEADGKVVVDVKKNKVVDWWEVYKFPNTLVYEQWRGWLEGELKKQFKEKWESEANYVDLVYGMLYQHTAG